MSLKTFIGDSSIAENIAFGIPRHLIDIDRVKQAAAQAQIASFIESKSDGYEVCWRGHSS